MKYKLTFGTSLLLAPLAYALHHFEEHIIFNFREWRSLYFPDSNPLSTELVFMVLASLTLIFVILHQVFRNRATAQSAVLFLLTTQVHNVFFHLGGTIAFSHFSPGLYSGILLYLPVNAFILYKAFEEDYLTWKSLSVLFVLGGIVFWTFEAVGFVVVLATVITTYIWLGFTSLKESRMPVQN